MSTFKRECRLCLLASQDALEVMSVRADFTDVTLVSEDTNDSYDHDDQYENDDHKYHDGHDKKWK